MEQPPAHRAQQIGLAAAQAIAGTAMKALRVRSGVDWTDEPAPDLTFLVDREQIQEVETSIKIAQRIRDELIGSGDRSYPYIRLLLQDEWERE